MQAIVHTRYGKPDMLELREIDNPRPSDNEVLVRVHAASVNSWDWDLVTGKPYLYRLMFGLSKPKYPVIGSDIAGRVEAIGSKVTRFQVGDEVFGDISGCGFGAFAEYACVGEDVLASKPASMSFEQAAAMPQAGVLALQGLRQGQIRQGLRVLLNGAGGGVGTFALQIAKHFGAQVTAVDGAAKLDMLRELRADNVIDYAQEDCTRNGTQYDLILDVVARRSVLDYHRALRPGGTLVIVGGSVATIIQASLLGKWLSRIGNKHMGLLLHMPNADDLHELSELFEAGTVVPVIDRSYPLSKVADAIAYLGAGHVRGKVVISAVSDGC